MAITGLAALVVQEAFDEILHLANFSSLMPRSTVDSLSSFGTSLAGAEMTTFLAPASR